MTDVRLVILDRDGVINFDSPDYIKSADEWEPIPGSLDAITRLTQAGIAVYIATNQAGVARGIFEMNSLEAIHEKLIEAVTSSGGVISGIEFCTHHPDDRCDCRKPAPGMLHRIAERSGIALAGQYFVGDSVKDVEAAEAAGCQPVLVLTVIGRATREERPDVAQVFDDLSAFADALLDGRLD